MSKSGGSNPCGGGFGVYGPGSTHEPPRRSERTAPWLCSRRRRRRCGGRWPRHNSNGNEFKCSRRTYSRLHGGRSWPPPAGVRPWRGGGGCCGLSPAPAAVPIRRPSRLGTPGWRHLRHDDPCPAATTCGDGGGGAKPPSGRRSPRLRRDHGGCERRPTRGPVWSNQPIRSFARTCATCAYSGPPAATSASAGANGSPSGGSCQQRSGTAFGSAATAGAGWPTRRRPSAPHSPARTASDAPRWGAGGGGPTATANTHPHFRPPPSWFSR